MQAGHLRGDVRRGRVTPQRETWLRAVYDLTAKYGRAPIPSEVAKKVGKSVRAARDIVTRAVSEGQLIQCARVSAYAATGVRVAPLTLLELGLPPVVYLAWPMSRHDQHLKDGKDAAGMLANLGVYAPTPYLIEMPAHQRESALPVAASLAMRVDAVVVVRDSLIAGRRDVEAAWRVGVPLSIVHDMRTIKSASDLWIPPCLQPVNKQGMQDESVDLSTARRERY